MINILEIENKNYHELWNSASNSTIFSSLEWLSSVCNEQYELKLFGIFRNSYLTAAFPFIKIKSRLLNHYGLPQLTPYTGILFSSNIDNNDKEDLLKAFKTFIDQRKKDSFYFAFPSNSESLIHFNHSSYKVKSNKTYLLDLKLSEDTLFNKLRNDKKRNIKAAINQDLTIKFEKNWNALSSLIEKTYFRQQQELNWLPTAKRVFDNLKNTFQVSCYIKSTIAASLFITLDNQKAYYMFGGFDSDLSNYNAGPYTMWNAILRSKELKKLYFDFEGSEVPAIEKYFLSFGSYPSHYYSIEYKSKIQSLINLYK